MARWNGTWQRIETADLKRLEAKSAFFDELRQAADDVFRADWPSEALKVFAMDRLRTILIQLDKTFGVLETGETKGVHHG